MTKIVQDPHVHAVVNGVKFVPRQEGGSISEGDVSQELIEQFLSVSGFALLNESPKDPVKELPKEPEQSTEPSSDVADAQPSTKQRGGKRTAPAAEPGATEAGGSDSVF